MNTPLRRVVGLGFRGAATVASLREAVDMALSHGHGPPTALATAIDKAETPALERLAAELGLPVLAIPLAELALQDAAPSSAVPARYGRCSLAEAAGLAGAGPGARLVVKRWVSHDGQATAAIAENTGP